MKQSVRILAFVAAVALITSAARADGPYWSGPATRAQGPLPWTGPYVGLNAGYAWHDVGGVYDNIVSPTDLSGTRPNGAIVGGQIGYNYRMDWFLMGVELDANAGTNSQSVVNAANGAQIRGDLSYLASARGRLGVLWSDVLLYGTIGVGSARHTFNEVNGTFSGEQHFTDTAAVYGGGLEWMVAYNVSVRAEYLRYDMSGTDALSPSFPGVAPGDFVKFRDIDIVRAGVNVRLAP